MQTSVKVGYFYLLSSKLHHLYSHVVQPFLSVRRVSCGVVGVFGKPEYLFVLSGSFCHSLLVTNRSIRKRLFTASSRLSEIYSIRLQLSRDTRTTFHL